MSIDLCISAVLQDYTCNYNMYVTLCVPVNRSLTHAELSEVYLLCVGVDLSVGKVHISNSVPAWF